MHIVQQGRRQDKSCLRFGAQFGSLRTRQRNGKEARCVGRLPEEVSGCLEVTVGVGLFFGSGLIQKFFNSLCLHRSRNYHRDDQSEQEHRNKARDLENWP